MVRNFLVVYIWIAVFGEPFAWWSQYAFRLTFWKSLYACTTTQIIGNCSLNTALEIYKKLFLTYSTCLKIKSPVYGLDSTVEIMLNNMDFIKLNNFDPVKIPCTMQKIVERIQLHCTDRLITIAAWEFMLTGCIFYETIWKSYNKSHLPWLFFQSLAVNDFQCWPREGVILLRFFIHTLRAFHVI